jgi:cell division protein FtsW
LSGGALSYLLLDHVKQRVDIWLLNPYGFIELGDKAYNQAYQVIQSLFAIGAGGLTGAGLGGGQPLFIPAVHTDFIFAAITEEMGLMGGLGIVLLYVFFIYRGLKVALKSRDDFSKLLASGLTALMGMQSFIIIAGVTKLLPLTGVTLPFISYGGSSLVANFIILGMLLNISHEAQAHE